jgi:hypothetical protein
MIQTGTGDSIINIYICTVIMYTIYIIENVYAYVKYTFIT